MSDLFWPGDDRASDHLTGESFLGALVAVEEAWLDLLVDHGIAPEAARHGFDVDPGHLASVAADADLAGNPVPAVLTLLRERPDTPPDAAHWLHRGLTSQDVVDSALMLLAQQAVADVLVDLCRQVERLSALAVTHRTTPMVARTLTQHAVPTTFGLVAATWLTAVLDAHEALSGVRFPVQVGGAAGTLAGPLEVGLDDPLAAAAELAQRLGLDASLPWHTSRSPVTRLGDALVAGTDAWGRLAGDVLTLCRPEIAEVSLAATGGSSTMPHKANPVLAVLVKRAALTTPALASTLHLCATTAVDQRPDGAWQAEWATLRDLLRRTLTAAAHTTDLLHGLRVDADRMAQTLAAATDGVHAEQRSLAAVAGHEPSGDYLGQATAIVDAVVERARAVTSPLATGQETPR